MMRVRNINCKHYDPRGYCDHLPKYLGLIKPFCIENRSSIGCKFADRHERPAPPPMPPRKGTMVIPTAEGATDATEAIKAAMDVGKWIMIAPDGRVWMNQDPAILATALLAIIGGADLKFGDN